MKKVFKILSRMEIESEVHYNANMMKTDHIVISINEPGGPEACIPYTRYCNGILRLHFDDIDEHIENSYSETLQKYKTKLFTKEQAREILDFVERHNNIQLILIHCHAGISRSAGVAAALSYILNQNDDDIIKQKPCFNRFVYRTILNEYFK